MRRDMIVTLDTALDWATLIGFVGMACIIFAYAYMTGAKRPNPFVQHGVNLAGAALLTVSLIYHPNLPSLVLEGFWAAIAIWGLVKALRERKRA
ncbi:MAG TPA: permease [Croceicoccus sp.]|nr:permease [Croceicoccus sp.]